MFTRWLNENIASIIKVRFFFSLPRLRRVCVYRGQLKQLTFLTLKRKNSQNKTKRFIVSSVFVTQKLIASRSVVFIRKICQLCIFGQQISHWNDSRCMNDGFIVSWNVLLIQFIPQQKHHLISQELKHLFIFIIQFLFLHKMLMISRLNENERKILLFILCFCFSLQVCIRNKLHQIVALFAIYVLTITMLVCIHLWLENANTHNNALGMKVGGALLQSAPF